MKILGLDSSGLVASVAVVEDDILQAEYTINYKKTHSQTLVPMLQEISQMIELELDTVDAIAIAAGPGSFTGLRIGAATAKGLGLAMSKPLVEVPTLEGLAYNLCGTTKLVCPIMDARRNQVYTGIYEFVSDECAVAGDAEAAANTGVCNRLQVVHHQCALDIGEIIDKLNELGREVIFLGDGVPVYSHVIAEKMQVPFSFAPANNNRQRAASVAALGLEYARQGKTVTAAEHQPEYLRKSQAEREQEEKEKGL